MARLRALRLIPVLLAASTVLVYSQVGEHDFVNYDDGSYVFENPRVQAGLTLVLYTLDDS